jgi:hypothetical protein
MSALYTWPSTFTLHERLQIILNLTYSVLRRRVGRLISFEQKKIVFSIVSNLNLTGVDGRPSVFRHVILTIFRTCVRHKLPAFVNWFTVLVRKENLFETDKLKSGVKPSIRRTGAELFDFLVFNRKYFDQNGGEKQKNEMN